MRRVTIILSGVLGSTDTAVFRVFGDRRIRVSLSDPYWIPPLLLGGTYEPEVAALLSSVVTEDCAFIDCGANIGWWSIFATKIIPRPEDILAVEPVSGLHSQLEHNADLNGHAFTCVRAAVWNKSATDLTMRVEKHHAGRSSIELGSSLWTQGYHHTETVQSITLEDLIDRYLGGRSHGIVVKLDIEGAELRALEGLGRFAEAVELIVYEDHGKDPRPRVTQAMLEAGFAIFHCDDSFRFRKIQSGASAQAVKRDPRRGYNFAASRPGSNAWTRLQGRCGQ